MSMASRRRNLATNASRGGDDDDDDEHEQCASLRYSVGLNVVYLRWSDALDSYGFDTLRLDLSTTTRY